MINSNLNNNTIQKSFEIVPPRYSISDSFINKIIKYEKSFDLLDITCCPMATLRVNPIAVAHRLILKGIKSEKLIVNFSSRDRNSLALQSEIFGALSIKLKNILIVKGDPITYGNSKNSKEVFELTTDQIINKVNNINKGLDFNNNETNSKFYINIFSTLNINRSFNEIKKTIQNRLRKGSKFFITQPIYSESDFEKIIKLSKSKDYKIFAGILPVKNKKILGNLLKKLGGITIDSPHLVELANYDDKKIHSHSSKHLKELIKVYKKNLDGLHLMTSGSINEASNLIKDL